MHRKKLAILITYLFPSSISRKIPDEAADTFILRQSLSVSPQLPPPSPLQLQPETTKYNPEPAVLMFFPQRKIMTVLKSVLLSSQVNFNLCCIFFCSSAVRYYTWNVYLKSRLVIFYWLAVYLTMLCVAKTTDRRVTGWLMNNKL
jgi:hypothetical protein